MLPTGSGKLKLGYPAAMVSEDDQPITGRPEEDNLSLAFLERYAVFELFGLDGNVEEDLHQLGVESIGPISDDDAAILKSALRVAKTVLVEREYIDKDYRNVYSGYYSKKFGRLSSRAIRIHFFDIDVELEDLRDGALFDGTNGELEARFQSQKPAAGLRDTSPGYIGYIVLRPTEYSRIGRCLLDPKKVMPLDSKRVACCAARYDAGVLGETLSVRAFPHQSQDAEAHTCAHTAVWALFRYLSQRYRMYKEQYPFDIAMLNKDLSVGRPLPGRGLYMDQVTAMFGCFGLAAELYVKKEVNDIKLGENKGWAGVQRLSDSDVLFRLLHSYVESGLPPIIGLPNHAAVAIGVEYADTVQVSRDSQVIPVSDFVSAIIVNDDTCPPYQRAARHNGTLHNAEAAYKYSCEENVDALVIPLPDKVFLPVEMAEMLIVNIVEKLDPPSPTSSEWDPTKPFVRSLYCTSSKNYKNSRKGDRDPLMPIILQLPMPHFVWVAQFAPLALWGGNKVNVVAEVVIDATAGRYDAKPYVWIRYPRRLTLNVERMYGPSAKGNPTIEYDVSKVNDIFTNMQRGHNLEYLV